MCTYKPHPLHVCPSSNTSFQKATMAQIIFLLLSPLFTDVCGPEWSLSFYPFSSFHFGLRIFLYSCWPFSLRHFLSLSLCNAFLWKFYLKLQWGSTHEISYSAGIYSLLATWFCIGVYILGKAKQWLYSVLPKEAKPFNHILWHYLFKCPKFIWYFFPSEINYSTTPVSCFRNRNLIRITVWTMLSFHILSHYHVWNVRAT